MIISTGPLLQELDITGKFAIPDSIITNPGSSHREVQIKALAFKKYLKTFFLKPTNFMYSSTLSVLVKFINLFFFHSFPYGCSSLGATVTAADL